MKSSLAAAVLILSAPMALAAATVGQPAPAFQAVDVQGKTVSLADFKGKHVVLEWVNPGCPYVRKHYDADNMQATQKSATDQGVVWLAINTTARDHVDYKSPTELSAWMKAEPAPASATLMDPDGTAGRAYGARTTPHLYVVNPAGTLVYAGAIMVVFVFVVMLLNLGRSEITDIRSLGARLGAGACRPPLQPRLRNLPRRREGIHCPPEAVRRGHAAVGFRGRPRGRNPQGR